MQNLPPTNVNWAPPPGMPPLPAGWIAEWDTNYNAWYAPVFYSVRLVLAPADRPQVFCKYRNRNFTMAVPWGMNYSP